MLCCCVVVLLCWCVAVCVCAVWRGYLFHGFMEWGFTCGCWFQGLVWTALPGTALPPEISFFLLSLGVFSLNFGGVFEGRDPQMCTFGFLGLSCETPAALKPPGFHGAPQHGGPPFGAPPRLTPRFGQNWIGQNWFWPKLAGPKTKMAKIGLAKMVKSGWPNEIGQSRSLPSELGVETSAEVDGQLFVVLSALTDGESFHLVTSGGRGFESWRSLHKSWSPYMGGRACCLLRAMLSPQRAKLLELMGAIENIYRETPLLQTRCPRLSTRLRTTSS